MNKEYQEATNEYLKVRHKFFHAIWVFLVRDYVFGCTELVMAHGVIAKCGHLKERN